jgi:hypothetical protein
MLDESQDPNNKPLEPITQLDFRFFWWDQACPPDRDVEEEIVARERASMQRGGKVQRGAGKVVSGGWRRGAGWVMTHECMGAWVHTVSARMHVMCQAVQTAGMARMRRWM